MPTKPHEDIIPDYRDKLDLLAILSQYSSLIEETRNFGSHTLAWMLGKVKKGDHHLVIFQFFRRSLELLDTLSVLIRNSCIHPCQLILRSLFEILLSIEYLIQEDLEKKGRDYLIWLKHKELNYLKKHFKNDPLYNDFAQTLKKDKVLKDKPIDEISNIEEAIKAKIKLIESDLYSSSENSYQKLKARQGKNPKWWFNLHDGPKDIIDLAHKLDRPAQYEVFYRAWAGYAHGTGFLDIEILKKDLIAIPQLRSPEGAEQITSMAMSLGLQIIKMVIQKYDNDKLNDFRLWYKNEIMSNYQNLRNKKIVVV